MVLMLVLVKVEKGCLRSVSEGGEKQVSETSLCNRLPRLVSVKVEKKVSETSLSRGRKKLSEISLSRVEKRFPRPVSEELKKGFRDQSR